MLNMETIQLCTEISTLAMLVSNTTVHDVFLDFSGHVNSFDCRICEYGWKEDEKNTYIKNRINLDFGNAIEKLKELKSRLEGYLKSKAVVEILEETIDVLKEQVAEPEADENDEDGCEKVSLQRMHERLKAERIKERGRQIPKTLKAKEVSEKLGISLRQYYGLKKDIQEDLEGALNNPFIAVNKY